MASGSREGEEEETGPLDVRARLKCSELFLHWLTLPAVQVALDAELVLLADGGWEPPDPVAFCAHARMSPESPPVSPVPRASPRRPSHPKSPLGAVASRSGSGGNLLLTAETISPAASAPVSPSLRRRSLGGAAARSAAGTTSGSPRNSLGSGSGSRPSSLGVGGAPSLGHLLPPFWGVRCPVVENEEKTATHIKSIFQSSGAIDIDCFAAIMKASHLPEFWAGAMFHTCSEAEGGGPITAARYLSLYHRMNQQCCDDADRFLFVVKPGCSHVEPDDLVPLVTYILTHHPGLEFLLESPEFHDRYVETAIARIFYDVNRSWDLRITASQLRHSDFLAVLDSLSTEADINMVPGDLYFSYEAFYVIYTHFWKLDSDHDLYISKAELASYSDNGLSERALDRIFEETVMLPRSDPGGEHKEMLCYRDFVYFILSDEDKTTATSIEYWFRVADLDGDGLLSMYELEHFYEEQEQRLVELAVEALSFSDCICQMIDMINPRLQTAISLSDLKRSGQASYFFNVFLNVNKFLDHEERDQFELQREREELGGLLPSDWDTFAQREYDLLAAEEEVADQGGDDLWSDSSEDGDDFDWGSVASGRGF